MASLRVQWKSSGCGHCALGITSVVYMLIATASARGLGNSNRADIEHTEKSQLCIKRYEALIREK